MEKAYLILHNGKPVNLFHNEADAKRWVRTLIEEWGAKDYSIREMTIY